MNNLQLEIIYWNLSSALEVAKYFNIQLLTQQTRKSNSTSHNCTQFVVCSGLVVPQQMLKDKIIPMINEEMKRLNIDVDDVYNALVEDE
ncbi:Conserved_hypothetical protein [Hexamita inflata]|uniref:Uncharacterized protein n=1 Tax=Hexamita inflata TaxID=28002 RepID=A0AA86NMJ7_9EUKA|nr:Conserved hypothetical protein [Hexamita inflata]